MSTLLHLPVAALLVAAGILKATEAAQALAPESYLFGSRPITFAVALAEIVFGCWLTFTDRRRLAKSICLILTSIFVVHAFLATLSGQASCGCFGSYSPPPRIMILVDFCMLTLIYFWDVEKGTRIGIWARHAFAALCFVAIGCSVMQYVNVNVTDSIHQSGSAGDVVMLRPDSWIGKDYPLQNVDPMGAQRLEGARSLVLFKPDCQECDRFLKEIVLDNTEKAKCEFLALSELPSDHLLLAHPETASHTTQLPSDRAWFCRVPLVIELNNGVVMQVSGKGK